jgi:hypothetical protein
LTSGLPGHLIWRIPDRKPNASHVRNAVARFDQVEGVSDEEREQAFANIKKAAKHYGVEMTARNWRDLGKPERG